MLDLGFGDHTPLYSHTQQGWVWRSYSTLQPHIVGMGLEIILHFTATHSRDGFGDHTPLYSHIQQGWVWRSYSTLQPHTAGMGLEIILHFTATHSRDGFGDHTPLYSHIQQGWVWRSYSTLQPHTVGSPSLYHKHHSQTGVQCHNLRNTVRHVLSFGDSQYSWC